MVCPLLSLMCDQVSTKEVKALRRCASGERPVDSFVKDVKRQATHVFGSLEAFIGINTWHSLFADDRFSGAIQIQLARLYKHPVPSADSPRLTLTLALCSPAHAILPQQQVRA